MFSSQNQGMSTRIVISFITYEKIIKIHINQARANFVCKNYIKLQPSIVQGFQIKLVQTITVRRKRNVTTNTGPSSEYFLNRFNRFDITFQMWRSYRSIIFQLRSNISNKSFHQSPNIFTGKSFQITVRTKRSVTNNLSYMRRPL